MGYSALFLRRLVYAPFETLIGGLAIVTALISLLHVGGVAANAYDAILPHWAAVAFQAGYLLSGLCLIAGVGAARGDVESAGLVIISASQITRAIVNVALLGAAVGAVSVAFAVLVVGACGTRLWLLIRAEDRGDDGG